MLEIDHLYFFAAGLIEQVDNFRQALNIGGPIRDDQHIGRRHTGQMAILGHHGPQYGHQFHC